MVPLALGTCSRILPKTRSLAVVEISSGLGAGLTAVVLGEAAADKLLCLPLLEQLGLPLPKLLLLEEEEAEEEEEDSLEVSLEGKWRSKGLIFDNWI